MSPFIRLTVMWIIAARQMILNWFAFPTSSRHHFVLLHP
jgi:hypothetical protein